MRFVIFPLGRAQAAPSDQLDHELARILQVPSATRSRIGRGQYLTASEHNPIGQLEEALKDILAAEPVHKRLSDAMGKKLSFTRLDILAQKRSGCWSSDPGRSPNSEPCRREPPAFYQRG
ncbi:acyl-CoA dehydrogenase [Ewingella americana]|uniref:Acyl-CoA dehydrogenase n=1 Tax=Ewingella americana TaxID=41202 RepID=A0A377NGX8_9GAMM|nr:acyl-CoA dehydrogenase [Ewingella americana]